eukprot:TRINITY_DN4534_c3_g1_i1.p1 TRINITY_DN4534_c3_g1~~TRINITY_DN4534_c3_g1_i1.p1  ORF type:complete len:187 (-),score=9.22 TRINITY_DN4534_c3_g1_i1:275-835(-)
MAITMAQLNFFSCENVIDDDFPLVKCREKQQFQENVPKKTSKINFTQKIYVNITKITRQSFLTIQQYFQLLQPFFQVKFPYNFNNIFSCYNCAIFRIPRFQFNEIYIVLQLMFEIILCSMFEMQFVGQSAKIICLCSKIFNQLENRFSGKEELMVFETRNFKRKMYFELYLNTVHFQARISVKKLR